MTTLICALLLALLPVDAYANDVYVPIVRTEPAPSTEAEASAQALRLWAGAPWQERAEMVVDPRLTEIARQYANELIQRIMDNPDLDYDSPALHISTDGLYPNERLRAAGYALPAMYPDRGNWVESVRLSQVNAKWTLRYLYDSPLSYDHMAGIGVFGTQTRVGVWVAFAPEGYARAYVFVSAPEPGAE